MIVQPRRRRNRPLRKFGLGQSRSLTAAATGVGLPVDGGWLRWLFSFDKILRSLHPLAP